MTSEATIALLYRLIEYLLVFSLSFASIVYGRKKLTTSVLPLFIAVIFVTCQLALKTYRWQMLPAYVSCLLLVISRLAQNRIEIRFLAIRIISVSLTALSLTAVLIFPLFWFPQPTGAFPVGQVRFYIENSDPYRVPGDFEIAVFYPGADIERNHPRQLSRRARYLWYPAVSTKRLAKLDGLPSFTLNHLKFVRTHSVMELTIAETDETFPVLFALHGGGRLALPTDSVQWAEELASHGYVVVSVAIPGLSGNCVTEDGRIVLFDEATWDRMGIEFAESQDAAKALIRGFDTAAADLHSLYNEYIEILPTYETIVAYRSKVISYLIDNLSMMKYAIPCLKNADFSRCGSFGESLGGSVAMAAAIGDNRMLAAASIDGFHYAKVPDAVAPVHAALLAVYAEPCEDCPESMNRPFYHLFGLGVYPFKISGTNHSSFGHTYLYSPLARVYASLGKIRGQRAHEISSSILLEFFDRILKRKTIAFSNYPELETLPGQ